MASKTKIPLLSLDFDADADNDAEAEVAADAVVAARLVYQQEVARRVRESLVQGTARKRRQRFSA